MDDGLITESRAWGEFLALRNDPVYRGEGVPRGNGQPVLVLPSLFGNDLYLHPIRRWLERIGYRPMTSSIAMNVGCPERLKARVARTIERRLDGSGELAIIGHSRGGLLGKALATRPPATSAPSGAIPGGVNIEVSGTHSGLVVNRSVYQHLARVLAGMI